MTNEEMDAISEKVADIIMKRFESERVEIAKKMLDVYLNTPFSEIKTTLDAGDILIAEENQDV